MGPLARFLELYQNVIYTPGPLLGVALLLAMVGAVLRPVSRTRKRSVRAECFLFASVGTILLLIPSATAVFDYRYLLPSIPLLSVGGVLGAHVIRRRLQQGARLMPQRATAARLRPRGLPASERAAGFRHR